MDKSHSRVYVSQIGGSARAVIISFITILYKFIILIVLYLALWCKNFVVCVLGVFFSGCFFFLIFRMGMNKNNEVVEKACELCQFCSRLTRNVLRISGSKGIFRRMNSAPLTSTLTTESVSPGQDGNKENSSESLLSPIKRDAIINTTVLNSPLRSRTLFDNHDSNSQDSGYAASDEPQNGFRFAEPSGFPPRKSGMDPSPLKKIPDILMSPQSKLSTNPAVKSSSEGKVKPINFYSSESFDDGFLELGDLDKSFSDENSELPAGLGNLLTGPLISLDDTLPLADNNTPIITTTRPPLRRTASMIENYTSPASSKAKVGLFRDDLFSPMGPSPCEKIPFKRPREVEISSAKRRKYNSLHTLSENSPRYKLQRSISETAATNLASVLHKNDLIADFSRPYALPIVSGRHEDLKSITSDTLANLLNGNYDNTISSYKIIDCRYPYEYEGGHIRGSINLYTREQVQAELFNESKSDEQSDDGRNILVFHCEFSLERGPTLYRFLRRCDRNISSYPSLKYPEVYLLHGGYESFFASHKSLCEPCSYQPMVDPKHENDLKKFRVKSNSWSGDIKRPPARSSLKRLGLF